MKPEVQKRILQKYARFFDDNIQILNQDSTLAEFNQLVNQSNPVQPIQFGFECEDGWDMLLENLLNEIYNHIINVEHNKRNRLKSKTLYNFSMYLMNRLPYKFKSLRKLGRWIYDNGPKDNTFYFPFYITQVKEKYGTLSFYYGGGDDYIDGLVSLAERLSSQICERCGTTINVGYTEGWNITICKSCHKKYADNLTWKKNE